MGLVISFLPEMSGSSKSWSGVWVRQILVSGAAFAGEKARKIN